MGDMGDGNTRRELLRWMVASSVVGSAVGTVGANQDDDESQEFLTEVIAGPDGAWRFEPEDVVIGLGETVEWYFDSAGHNVTAHPEAADETHVPEGADYFATYEGDNHLSVAEEGSTFTHTFTVPGTYAYVCTPHLPQMVGSVTVEPCVDETVVVAPDGEEVFEPAELEVDLGNTVEWVLEEDGHTVSAHPDVEGTSVPEGAEPFASYEDDDHDDTLEAGESFVHTFETPGTYEYVCTQHEGMEGVLEVRDEPALEVAVGPDGEAVFDPAEAEVEVGDVVRWRAETDGHSVSTHPDLEGTSVPEGAEPFTSYEDDDHDEALEAGETFDHRFVAIGEYEYVSAGDEGMAGSVSVGPCSDDTDGEDEAEEDGEEEAETEGDVHEVVAGPDGAWAFEPDELEIGVGDTVEWYFDSAGHNVTSHPDASDKNENPEGAEPFTSYEGDNHMSVNEAGTTYAHTFEVPGEYVYVCTPHENSMVGEIVVTE